VGDDSLLFHECSPIAAEIAGFGGIFSVSISFWRRLSTPVRQLIILLLLVLLLMVFLVLLGIMSMRRVQACLDSELYYQTLALRSWFVDEGYYLRDEAELLAEFDAFDDLLSTHDDVQMRRLMALYQSTHEVDGIYLVSNSSEVFTSSATPPLDDEAVLGLDLVRMGFNGQTVAEMVTLNGKIWLMSVAPHVESDGGIDGVFLIVREVDPVFLEKLASGMNGAVILTDGNVLVKSHSGEIPDAVSDSLSQAMAGGSDEALQPFTIHYDDMSYRVLVAPLTTTHASAYGIALAKNAEIINEALWQTLRWGTVFGIILIVIVLILVQFHIVEIFRPLGSLVRSTQRIAAGNLDEPLEPAGVAEVYELAINFEVMRSRLKELLERERSMSENLEVQVQETSQALDDVCRAREHLLAQLISSQEEERRRVSRELHDETSQGLANLIVRLGTLARLVDDEKVLAQLQVLRTQAVDTLEGVNRIVMDLRPGLLDEYGLVPAVEWYADARLTAQGVSVKMKVEGTPRELSSYTQASIYRVIQEAINNILQHAQANQVLIQIQWLEDHLRIEIEDNGRGFDMKRAFDGVSGHYGLLGMRERVSLLNGALYVHSAPGEGTQLVIEVPYTMRIVRKDDQKD